MRFLKFVLMITLIAVGSLSLPPVTGQESQTAEQPAKPSVEKTDASAEEKKLIEKLERYLTNTRWLGQFTMTGKQLNDLTPEYYEITKAKKAPQGDFWMLSVRIKYGDKDSTMDLPPIEVKWAGGTPVITVDQVSVPGFGTFDARVVIRKNKYAGTWSHNSVGGHLFGTIERLDEKSSSEKEAVEPNKAESKGSNSK